VTRSDEPTFRIISGANVRSARTDLLHDEDSWATRSWRQPSSTLEAGGDRPLTLLTEAFGAQAALSIPSG
jgi:hypothetical protein